MDDDQSSECLRELHRALCDDELNIIISFIPPSDLRYVSRLWYDRYLRDLTSGDIFSRLRELNGCGIFCTMLAANIARGFSISLGDERRIKTRWFGKDIKTYFILLDRFTMAKINSLPNISPKHSSLMVDDILRRDQWIGCKTYEELRKMNNGDDPYPRFATFIRHIRNKCCNLRTAAFIYERAPGNFSYGPDIDYDYGNGKPFEGELDDEALIQMNHALTTVYTMKGLKAAAIDMVSRIDVTRNDEHLTDKLRMILKDLRATILEINRSHGMLEDSE